MRSLFSIALIISSLCAEIVADNDKNTASTTTVLNNRKPNIVLILTDDQDIQMFGLDPMKKTRKLMMEEGTFFNHMFVTTPICCPSRSSILTGQYVHNQGTKNNSVSGGCSSPWWQKNKEPYSFARYLNDAGYLTFYAGKYLNRYGKSDAGGPSHVPRGWDHWYGLIGNSVYYNYGLSENGTQKYYANRTEDYLTTVVTRKAAEFLEFAGKTYPDRPILAVLSVPAPHAPFTPAQRYAERFTDTKAPRFPNFGVHGKEKHWLVRNTPFPMTKQVVNVTDSAYRNRWRTLLSVDDLVEWTIDTLTSIGRLNNSYIFYTSDNGYHCGQFCMPLDKRLPYEFDIRVPLIVRGVGVPKNRSIDRPVLNIDLAPTFLDLAEIKIPRTMDGRSIARFLRPSGYIHPHNFAANVVNNVVTPEVQETAQSPLRHLTPSWRKHFLVEYWGEGNSGVPPACASLQNRGVAECHPSCICEDSFNNTYACVRTAAGVASESVYCEFRDNDKFVEVYDLKKDPYQLKNFAKILPERLRKRYRASLMKLKTCAGVKCP